MYPLHKAVEVNPQLAIEGQALVEVVDQIGLAPADATPEIKSAYGNRAHPPPAPPRPRDQGTVTLLPIGAHELAIERVQFFHGMPLRGVLVEILSLQVPFVAFQGGCHGRPL